jgi:hypothetical protein
MIESAVPDYPDKRVQIMSLRINSEAPNFTAETTEGTINFHDWIGDGWNSPKSYIPIVPQPK